MPRSLSYGAKVYGTAVLLIGLTIGVTSISMVLADRIESRLTVLAEVYAPLADGLAVIETRALRQALLFERALLIAETRPDDPRLARDEVAFDALGKEIDGEIEQAIALAEGAGARSLPEASLDALAGLGPALAGVERAHDGWEQRARAALLAPPSWTVERGERVDHEADAFSEALDGLRAEMGRHTLDAAARARDDEALLQRLDLALTAVAATSGLLLAALLTAGLVRPILALLGGMLQVRSGELRVRLEAQSTDELGQLTDGFNLMVGELVQKARLTETFGRFVDPRIVRDLIDHPEITNAVGRRQPMSVLFSDIAGFTTLSERLAPQVLVTVLNAWLETMSRPIQAERGVIDKYIGDAILAWWGAPFVPQDEAPLRAVRAALAKRNQLGVFNSRLPALLGADAPDDVRLDLRMGVATGPVIVGTIGSEQARDYTVIGDTVNAGARLEAACKMYGLRILIDEATAAAVADEIAVREVDSLCLAGKTSPSRIFEPLDPVAWLGVERRGLADRYSLGLSAYRAGDFAAAEVHFAQCLSIVPGDGPSTTLLARARTLRRSPPDEWDGVWVQRK